ncbi:hypothetical protein [Paenibacillus planticolens]|uniref:hypothetical protein n=1 Tax=Paenibacillus planticolens TaxID=2654976 RepID=UPI001FEAFDCC|nr:hypothetical protein [Paenibacillus planticolens]
MLEKTDVNSIINTLCEEGIIDNKVTATNNKTGTTDGIVYLLSEHEETKYVLKIDSPHQIALAEQFLRTYRYLALFPKILYTDPSKAYIVYTYMTGTTHYDRGLKINWLTILVK